MALRLQPSLLEEARRAAESEGASLNQLINVAVAEKLSALRTEEYFRQRAERGNVADAKRILRKVGRGAAQTPAMICRHRGRNAQLVFSELSYAYFDPRNYQTEAGGQDRFHAMDKEQGPRTTLTY